MIETYTCSTAMQPIVVCLSSDYGSYRMYDKALDVIRGLFQPLQRRRISERWQWPQSGHVRARDVPSPR